MMISFSRLLVLGLLLVTLPATFRSCNALTGEVVDPAAALRLPVWGYLAGEQLVRLYRLSRGTPSGGALGHLVRPMARRLF